MSLVTIPVKVWLKFKILQSLHAKLVTIADREKRTIAQQAAFMLEKAILDYDLEEKND